MFRVVEVKERILADNEKTAELIRDKMRAGGTLFVNLMGSPGAGKTSVLLNLISLLSGRYSIGVMEADVDSDVDAKTVSDSGVRVIQLHTAGLCHMDADMTLRGLDSMGIDGLDIVFLENVGNLVCPAEFEVGADIRMMILSVPEGDDKPLKYPLMFQTSDVLLINKIDTAPVFDFDFEMARERAEALNPSISCFSVSAKDKKGFEAVAEYISEKAEERRSENAND